MFILLVIIKQQPQYVGLLKKYVVPGKKKVGLLNNSMQYLNIATLLNIII